MIKAVVVSNKKNEAKELADKLNVYFEKRVVFEELPLTNDIIGDIRKKCVDMLVTVDLTGFDRTTFTDGVAYNLLDCKQVHLIFHKKLENEKYLAKPLSIAMFFGCAGEAYEEELKNRYPNIPWSKVIFSGGINSDWKIAGEETREIAGLIEEVLRECQLV